MRHIRLPALAAAALCIPVLASCGADSAAGATPSAKRSGPCAVVRYMGPKLKVLEVRVAAAPADVAATIEAEFWESVLEPSLVQQERHRHGEQLAGYTDEEVALVLHEHRYPSLDRDRFVAEAQVETVDRTWRGGEGFVLVGGETYLPRNREILGIEGC